MALLEWVSYVPPEWRARLLGGSCSGAGLESYREIWHRSVGACMLDRILDLNIRTYLLDDLLPKVDRMSMAHALEVRAPFLDRELAELAFRLPVSARARALSLKRVLRAAVADLLPPEILRRPKRGFGVPLDRWFRQDLASYVRAMLCASNSRVRDYLAPSEVDSLVWAHQQGAGDYGDALWSLLTLEVFLRREGW
jgi:asparagine synthase (glutamine-hydrolysing)